MGIFDEAKVKAKLLKLKMLTIPALKENLSAKEYNQYSNVVLNEIAKILKNPFHLTQMVKNDPGESLTFYRARKSDEILNPSIYSEYSFPPVTFCKRALRANLPLHPVFYASNHAMTTVKETIQNGNYKGEILTVSRWIMKDTNTYHVAPFLFHGLSTSHPWYSRVEKIKTEGLIDGGMNPKDLNGAILMLKGLANEFFNDKDYRLSASIAHSYLYSNIPDFKCDLMAYPSIQNDGKSVNFAVHPNFVHDRLYIDKLYTIELGEHNSSTGITQIRLHSVGNPKDNHITWNNKPSDFEYNLFKERFGIT
jgi:hypothetical protein